MIHLGVSARYCLEDPADLHAEILATAESGVCAVVGEPGPPPLNHDDPMLRLGSWHTLGRVTMASRN